MRFFVKRKKDKSTDRANHEEALAACATTPERLMATITNSMGEICDSKEEFDELLILLMSMAPRWVKEVAMVREHNVRAEKMQGKPPKPLIL